ncbi:MAG: glycosyltransferase family 4 protein, partial [Desulforhabdus sp.]|nr:glycosyltransferase family 4 protein [Desulforhabdus sp.]
NVYLEQRLYKEKNNRIIVANSLLCKRHVEKYYRVPESRIRVIYHGVDHVLFNPHNAAAARSETRRAFGIEEHSPVILFVSNNWKRKGLSTLLHALGLNRSERPLFHLAVVGRGNPKTYAGLAEKLGLSKQVHFIGHTDDILRYFGIADLVVLPTLYDSFGNVCLEGMACGLPVITSSSSGASELIRNGENGYVLNNPTDHKELADLLRLCSDPGRLKIMGRIAREISLQYTPARNALETVEVCRQVVAEASKPNKHGARKYFKNRDTHA